LDQNIAGKALRAAFMTHPEIDYGYVFAANGYIIIGVSLLHLLNGVSLIIIAT
jgi:hypothetical protein